MGSSLSGYLIYGVQLSADSPELPFDVGGERFWWQESHEGICPVEMFLGGRRQYAEAEDSFLVCPSLTIEGYEAGTDVTDLVQNLIGCPLEEGEAVERFKAALVELGITEEPRWYMGGYYG